MVDASELGFSTDPECDNTPAWNAWAESGPDWVTFPGEYVFKTPPNTVGRPVRIDMAGANIAAFVRDYQPATALEKFISFRNTATIENLVVIAKSGTGGMGVAFDGLHAGKSKIDGGYISARAGANWAVPLYGSGGDQSLGLRSLDFRAIEVFAATVHLVWLVNVQGATLDDVNCYPAGGTVDHVTIQHFGSFRSHSIDWESRYLTRAYVYNSDNIAFGCNNPVALNLSGCVNVKNR